MRKKIPLCVLPLAAFVLALATHLYRLGYKDFQGHEAYVVRVAGFVAAGGWRSLFYFNHGPGRVLLAVPVFWTGWTDAFGFRFSHALMGAGTTVLIFWLARMLFPARRIAIIATVLYAVAGTAVLQRMANGVGAFVFFSTLTLCGVVVYLHQKKNWGLIIFIPAWVGACWMLLDGVFLGFGILLSYALFRGRTIDRRFAFAFASVVVIVSAYLALWVYLPYRWEGEVAGGIQGASHLLTRGTSGITSRPFYETWAVLYFYNGLAHTLILCAGLMAGLLTLRENHAAQALIGFAAAPVLYFSLHHSPTTHIVGFLPILVIWSALGWDWLMQRGRGFALAGAVALIIAATAGSVHTWGEMLRFWPPDKPAAYGWGPLWHKGYAAADHFIAARARPSDAVTVSEDPYIWRCYSAFPPVAAHKDNAFTTRFALTAAPVSPSITERLRDYTIIARVYVAGQVTLIVYEQKIAGAVQPEPVRLDG